MEMMIVAPLIAADNGGSGHGVNKGDGAGWR